METDKINLSTLTETTITEQMVQTAVMRHDCMKL